MINIESRKTHNQSLRQGRDVIQRCRAGFRLYGRYGRTGPFFKLHTLRRATLCMMCICEELCRVLDCGVTGIQKCACHHNEEQKRGKDYKAAVEFTKNMRSEVCPQTSQQYDRCQVVPFKIKTVVIQDAAK
ncbi:hypothetical protein ANN_22035 [Periplaneta americana]|uniref:Uncharacterized protein n=1 Tax=Periplaneta americana TaxID=6978 RepID=A0ABQ8S7T6_PERAM|nr:hypothetical protein ANN_22035 [Periplaneta americana]